MESCRITARTDSKTGTQANKELCRITARTDSKTGRQANRDIQRDLGQKEFDKQTEGHRTERQMP